MNLSKKLLAYFDTINPDLSAGCVLAVLQELNRGNSLRVKHGKLDIPVHPWSSIVLQGAKSYESHMAADGLMSRVLNEQPGQFWPRGRTRLTTDLGKSHPNGLVIFSDTSRDVVEAGVSPDELVNECKSVFYDFEREEARLPLNVISVSWFARRVERLINSPGAPHDEVALYVVRWLRCAGLFAFDCDEIEIDALLLAQRVTNLHYANWPIQFWAPEESTRRH